MSVICLNCEGWGCPQCLNERESARGGEQGLSPLEVENTRLRDELHRVKSQRDSLSESALMRVPGGVA